VLSVVVVGIVTLLFVLVGQINRLAPIVTLPFLLTYAAIDYAHFALCQARLINMASSLKATVGSFPANDVQQLSRLVLFSQDRLYSPLFCP
jgi:hypothetical protein